MCNVCTDNYVDINVNAKELLLTFANPVANLSAIFKVTQQVMIY